MTDIVITATAVIPADDAKVVSAKAGAALVGGQLVYQDTDGSVKLTDSDGAAALRKVYGMVCNSAVAIGQVATILRKGRVTMNAVLTAGNIYVASDTAGGVMPAADLEAGDYTTTLGIAVSTTVLDFQIHEGGVAYVAPA